jgi:pimeloyl-ACP methyl ester carboxylesterase
MRLLTVAVAALAALGAGALAAGATVGSAPTESTTHGRDVREVAVAGGRLHVVILGSQHASGPTLLLLHGASGNSKDLELSIGGRLAATHRVVLVDRPGHGRSDRLGGREMASPARQGAAIVEALDRIGVRRVVVVGHSWSGALATNLALDHSDRVSALVLLAPATHPWPTGVAWYNHVAATPVLGRVFAATVAAPVGLLGFDAALGGIFAPHEPPRDYAARTESRLVLRPAEFQANAQDIADLKPFVDRQSPRYGEIAVPTTVVTSDRDDVVSPELHSRTIARQIGGARLVVIPAAGHMPQWTATDRVVAEIEAIAARARR